MVIFHSYVSLPEGRNLFGISTFSRCLMDGIHIWSLMDHTWLDYHRSGQGATSAAHRGDTSWDLDGFGDQFSGPCNSDLTRSWSHMESSEASLLRRLEAMVFDSLPLGICNILLMGKKFLHHLGWNKNMLKPTGMFTLCLPLINWCRILSDHPIFKSFFVFFFWTYLTRDFSYLTKKCQVQLSRYPPLNSWSLGTTGRSRYIGQIGVGVGTLGGFTHQKHPGFHWFHGDFNG